jgi:hypothetical protein
MKKTTSTDSAAIAKVQSVSGIVLPFSSVAAASIGSPPQAGRCGPALAVSAARHSTSSTLAPLTSTTRTRVVVARA